MRYILLLFIVLFSSLILSVISLTTYTETRHDTIEVSLSNGLRASLYEIFGYNSDLEIRDVVINITSFCDEPINVSILKVDENYTIEEYVLEPYSSIQNIKCVDMYSILSIGKHNCSIRLDTYYEIEHKPYLLLALPAFILFIIGSVLVFGMISR